jgi:hypothetical protein
MAVEALLGAERLCRGRLRGPIFESLLAAQIRHLIQTPPAWPQPQGECIRHEHSQMCVRSIGSLFWNSSLSPWRESGIALNFTA